MQVILNEKEYDNIRNKINKDFAFCPLKKDWLKLSAENKRYLLNSVWTEEQEKLVNSIFKKFGLTKMYALDLHHDCFVFDPNEDIPLDYFYYDKKRDVNVYFPSYYPNGDFYFFVSMDWKLGLFGHPFEREIYVMGTRLIQEFDKITEELNITENYRPEKLPTRFFGKLQGIFINRGR